MAVDMFSALGVDPGKYPLPMTSSSGAGAVPGKPEIPTMSVRPASNGIDMFQALGIDPSKTYEPVQQKTAPATPSGKMTGWSPNIGAGIKSGAIAAVSSLVDPILRLVDTPEYPPKPGPMQRFLEGVGGSPDEVVPSTPGQAAARAAAGGATGMLAMGGGALGQSVPRTVASLGKAALTGAAGGVTGQAAEHAAPDWAKPLAGFAGNLVGNIGAEAAVQGARMIARPAFRAAGELGVAPPKWMGGPGKVEVSGGTPGSEPVKATASQLLAKGRQLGDMLGPEGTQQLNTFGDVEAQARALEMKLGKPDITDADRVATQRALNVLQPQREQLVPGYQPTTAQLVPTQKAVGFERDMRTTNNEAFAGRATDQNAAMTRAVQGMAPTDAGPETVSSLFLRRLDDLQQSGQQAIATDRSGVTGQTGALGGQEPIGVYGQQTRGALQSAKQPVHAATAELWSQVDPEGKWALPSTAVSEAASKIDAEMSPTTKVDGQEADLIDRAKKLPSVVKFAELGQIRSDINAAMMRLSGERGSEPNVRRLTLLKGSVDQAIRDAVEHISSVDDGVADRMNGMFGGDGSGGQSLSGGAGGQGASGKSEPGPGGSSGEGGGVGEGARGQGSPYGDRGLAAEQATGIRDLNPLEADIYADLAPKAAAPALAPNFDAEAADRYGAAVAATREEKQTFGQGGVGQILRPGRYGEDFRVSRGDVPGEIFTRGPSEPEEVTRFIKAVGGADKAADIGQNVLAHELIDRKIIHPDGTIDTGKFVAWQRQRRATIDQFPGLGDKFRSAQEAQVTLDQTVARHTQELRDFETGAARHFLKADPQVAIGRVFTSGNSTAAARNLYNAVKDHPDALAGARRGFIDHLDQKFNVAANPEESGGVIKSKSFRDFMDQHRNAFKVMFGGQGVQNIEMVEAALNRAAAAQQKEATAGSNSAQKAIGAAKHGASIGAGGSTALFALIGEHLAEHAMGAIAHEGILAGAASVAGVAGGLWMHALRQAAVKTSNDLGREMMLHPDLARTLLQRVDAQKDLSVLAQRKIGAAIQGAVLSSVAQSSKGTNRGL